MIEHFQKFDDGSKSLLPLSFSHLNEFAFYRERWALRRIFGYEFPTSASAIRGQVVESGINMFLNGLPIEEAREKMLSEYDENCSRINDPKIEDERNNLVPLFELGTKKFQDYAYRWRFIDYQRKLEVEIDDIPFTGYTDFYFEDNHTREDFFIDEIKEQSLAKYNSDIEVMTKLINAIDEYLIRFGRTSNIHDECFDLKAQVLKNREHLQDWVDKI